jgi:hypothetical protein
VPLNADGKLTVVASANLGALGTKDGAPVTCDWERPSVALAMLPWLAILGLLALRPNRSAAAWLIWLPLGVVIASAQALPSILPAGTDFLRDSIAALAAGLAAVWLLSNYFQRQHGFVAFLGALLALAAFSGLAFLSLQDWSFARETFQGGIVLALGVLVSAVALTLAGLICRRRFRPLGLYVWLLLLLPVIWLAIAVPFLMLPNGPDWSEVFVPVLAAATINFATLLPFLLLSSASPFYRERLKSLLHVRPPAPPVIAPLPVPEASLKT